MENTESKPNTSLILELGTLPSGAIVSEEWIAERFGRERISVKRAVQRGELPVPVVLFGESRWTVGAIVRHFEKRIEQETKLLDTERARAMGKAS